MKFKVKCVQTDSGGEYRSIKGGLSKEKRGYSIDIHAFTLHIEMPKRNHRHLVESRLPPLAQVGKPKKF